MREESTLRRIKSLAIPTACKDVWICPDPCGHLQATGWDARGRKQYRYHPRWREVREETKFNRMVALQELERFDSQAEAKRNVRSAIESVAKRLGNTPTICRKCYIHPEVINSYLDGTLAQSLRRRAKTRLAATLLNAWVQNHETRQNVKVQDDNIVLSP